jgi:hypothetical protein
MADAQDLVRRCKGCQFFAKQQHVPAQVPRTIPPSWPFTRLQAHPGGVGQIHKCIEVRAVARVTSKEAAWFIEYITHRFGVSNRIVTDLGKAFTWSGF